MLHYELIFARNIYMHRTSNSMMCPTPMNFNILFQRESGEAMVGFHLLNQYLAKRLWKAAVEHHAFFRLKQSRVLPRKRFPLSRISGSSQHQFSGRTFFQYRTSTNEVDRPMLNGNGVRTLADKIKHSNRTASVPASLNRGQYRKLYIDMLH